MQVNNNARYSCKKVTSNSATDELKEEIEDGELIDDDGKEDVEVIAVIEKQENNEISLACSTEGTQRYCPVPEGQRNDGTSFRKINEELVDFKTTDDVSVSSREHRETTGRTRKREERKRSRKRDDVEREQSKRFRRRRRLATYDSSRACSGSGLHNGSKDEQDVDYETLFVRGASPVTFGVESHLENQNPFRDYGFDEGKRDKSSETHSGQDFPSSESSLNKAAEENSLLDDKKTKKGSAQETNASRSMDKSRSRRSYRLSMKAKLKKDLAKNKRNSPKDKMNVPLCTFFMQGKCHKRDDCPFSHNFCQPRKMELCRFYLMDGCAKDNKCLYLHQEFPCKFYHTGLKCFSGDKCKFSHAPMSKEMNNALLKHLMSNPKMPRKSLLHFGDEGMTLANYTADLKKIPSLFDIHIPTPVELTLQGKDVLMNDSPMKTSLMESERDVQDGTSTPMPQSPSFDVRGLNRLWGSDDTDGISNFKYGNRIVNEMTEIESLDTSIPKTDSETIHENSHGNGKINHLQKQAFSITTDEGHVLKSKCSSSIKCVTLKTEQKVDCGFQAGDITSVPLHLSKKPLELFLRIQKQQRERTSCNDQKFDDAYDNSPKKCLSSDEEDNLSSIMKNISKKNLQATAQQEMHLACNKCDTQASSLPLQMEDVKEIQKDKSVINLLSSIDLKNILNAASAVSPPSISTQLSKSPIRNVAIRDPRLIQKSLSVDSFLKAGLSAQGRESSSTVTEYISTTSAVFLSNHSHIFSKRDPRKARDLQETESDKRDIKHYSQPGSENTSLSNNHVKKSDTYDEAGMQSAVLIAATSGIDAGKKMENTLVSDFENASFRDTDLRQIMYDVEASRSVTSDGQPSCSVSVGDVDWRVLPFKPVPMHSPATEIDASLYSHPPIHYRVQPIIVPEPDFTSLKQNISAPQVQKDPRLRKILQSQLQRYHNGL